MDILYQSQDGPTNGIVLMKPAGSYVAETAA